MFLFQVVSEYRTGILRAGKDGRESQVLVLATPRTQFLARTRAYFMNLDARPTKPPCCCPWLFRYIFSAVSPACRTADSLLAPSATLP